MPALVFVYSGMRKLHGLTMTKKNSITIGEVYTLTKSLLTGRAGILENDIVSAEITISTNWVVLKCGN